MTLNEGTKETTMSFYNNKENHKKYWSGPLDVLLVN
jgi:hypothetical protein